MNSAGTPGTRAAALARRLASTPGWPLAAAGVLSLVAMIEVVLRQGSDSDIEVPLLLSVVATGPIALAPTIPILAALPITGVFFIFLSRDHTPLPVAAIVALLIAIYFVAARHAAPWAAVVVAPFVIYAILQPWQQDLAGRLGAILLLALVLVAAATGRSRRARAASAAHHATERALAGTLLDHAARGERARIARELHDVVAHHLSMISVQAEAARLTTPGMPADGAQQLNAIGETARAALTEMRRLLGVLREDAGTADLSPQPDLRQLTELVDEARESTGTSMKLIVRGNVAPLDPGVELAAYRIVQEALTNARRHAPGAAVDVELDYGTDALRLLVRDNGPGPSPGARAGHGVLGMRERATMVGGTLWTGLAPSGGYLVTAVLPRRSPP